MERHVSIEWRTLYTEPQHVYQFDRPNWVVEYIGNIGTMGSNPTKEFCEKLGIFRKPGITFHSRNRKTGFFGSMFIT